MGVTGSITYFTGTFSTMGSMLELMSLDSSDGGEVDAIDAGRGSKRPARQERPHLVADAGVRSIDRALPAIAIGVGTAAGLVERGPELPARGRQPQVPIQEIRPHAVRRHERAQVVDPDPVLPA